LSYLNDFLQTNSVGKASAWLKACHANGDLERRLSAFADEHRPKPEADDGWPHVTDLTLWGRLVEQLGGDDTEALRLAQEEAEALGSWNPQGRLVLKNVLINLANDDTRRTA
jgi:hypothetical protein